MQEIFRNGISGWSLGLSRPFYYPQVLSTLIPVTASVVALILARYLVSVGLNLHRQSRDISLLEVIPHDPHQYESSRLIGTFGCSLLIDCAFCG